MGFGFLLITFIWHLKKKKNLFDQENRSIQRLKSIALKNLRDTCPIL